MTFQEMKQLLISYPDISRKIFNLQEEIKKYKAAAQSTIEELRSPVVDGMPRGTEISDSTYAKVQKVVDEYDTRIAQLMNDIALEQEQQSKLFDLLQHLDPDEYKIIELRYLKGIRWEHIPCYAHFSRKHCFRLHDRAIYKLIDLCDNKDDTK